MKIEYVPRRFQSDSLALIDKINSIIEDYQNQGFSLTLRQVYYQLVARAIIPNNERSYKNIGSLINDGRLAGLIDWEAIEDRTRTIRGLSHWYSPEQIVKSAASSYRRDHWEGQRNYVEVWVEKDALVGVVGDICNKLDVSYLSCRGYVSQSEMYQAATRLNHYSQRGRHPVVLHLGDHDPSGQDISRDITNRLDIFEASDVEFLRIALNMDQIQKYNPPPNPTKLSDSRASGYVSRYGYDSWELDALEPSVISKLIQSHILRYQEPKIYNDVLEMEKAQRSELWFIADHYQDIIEDKYR